MPEPRPALAFACLWAASPAWAQDADTMMAGARARTAVGRCVGAADEIMICDRADARLRYRLPLPTDRDPGPAAGTVGMAELLRTPGECAPMGPRRCTKREARAEGLGGGRDPLSLATGLVTRLLDPDAEVAPLPPLPR